jgi:hypothetical protein
MREILTFEPAYTAEKALQEFADQKRIKQYVPEAISKASDAERLRSIMEGRKQNQQVDLEGKGNE